MSSPDFEPVFIRVPDFELFVFEPVFEPDPKFELFVEPPFEPKFEDD